MTTDVAIKGKKGSVAVLDIGTNKLACFIAEPNDAGELSVTGIGHRLADGFGAGAIINAAEAETSIKCVVNAAEEMAGDTVENIIVSLSGTHIYSHVISVELGLSGESVSERDIVDVLREGCRLVCDAGRSVIHCVAVNYELDNQSGIKYPLNMFGRKLGADLHIISADDTKLKNLSECIANCHLNVSEFISSSYAAALGVLESDEKEIGATVIDMGAGQTSVTVFSGGKNAYSAVAPIGGRHVTSDIAQCLSISLVDAEKIKNLHGSAIAAPKDTLSMIDVQYVGDPEDNGFISKADLIDIIRPRVEEIIEMVGDRLESSGVSAGLSGSIVLTGGASQLSRIDELTGRMLRRRVRVASPIAIDGLADSFSGPAFSSAVGMLRYISNRSVEDALISGKYGGLSGSGIKFKISELIDWIKNNF